MNLVIDDAVEVKQATKEKPESRRSLGQCSSLMSTSRNMQPNVLRRSNLTEGRQCLIDPELERIKGIKRR